MISNRSLLWRVIVLALVSAVVLVACSAQRSDLEPTVDPLDAIRTQIQVGNYDSARAALEELLGRDPDDPEAHFQLGLVYFNLGNLQLAEDHFRRALTLDPARAAAVHHNLGVLAYQVGDNETAVAEFQAALEIEPDDADTHYQLGATYLLQAFPLDASAPDSELLFSAESQFARALEIAPGKPEALVGMANVYMLRNDMQQAVSLLEDAVTSAPEMREALFALGRAYAAVGEVDQARTTLQRFLETDPPAMWAQQGEEMLRELSGGSTD